MSLKSNSFSTVGRKRLFADFLSPEDRISLLNQFELDSSDAGADHGKLILTLRRRAKELEKENLSQATSYNLFADLLAVGWRVSTFGDKNGLLFEPNDYLSDEFDDKSAKEKIKKTLLVARDQQLSTPAVRTFLSSMERPRAGISRLPISSVIDNGEDLANKLSKLAM